MPFTRPGDLFRSEMEIMNLDKIIFRNAALVFGIFCAFAVWAFWPSYFSNPFRRLPIQLHVHGILMTIWLTMLVTQPVLIRLKKKAAHRLIGKSTYFLVPLILISGVNISHSNMVQSEPQTDYYYLQFGHMYISLVVFAIFYGLAVKHRKDPMVHARYMICTIFPIFTPVFSRIIGRHFDSALTLLPDLGGNPLIQIIGFAMADLLLVCFALLDWRYCRRLNVFPVALGVLLAYHMSDFVLYRFDLWRSFVDWVVRLPLS